MNLDLYPLFSQIDKKEGELGPHYNLEIKGSTLRQRDPSNEEQGFSNLFINLKDQDMDYIGEFTQNGGQYALAKTDKNVFLTNLSSWMAPSFQISYKDNKLESEIHHCKTPERAIDMFFYGTNMIRGVYKLLGINENLLPQTIIRGDNIYIHFPFNPQAIADKNSNTPSLEEIAYVSYEHLKPPIAEQGSDYRLALGINLEILTQDYASLRCTENINNPRRCQSLVKQILLANSICYDILEISEKKEL